MGNTEFIVIVPFGLLGAYCAIQACSAVDPCRKSRFSLYFWLAMGIVFGIGGWISTVRITHSARPQVEGVVHDLQQWGGRSKSSNFVVITDLGQSIGLNASYAGPELQNGQRVRVKFLEEYGAVLDLEILDGGKSGWQLHKSDDLSWAHFSAFAGPCLAIFGILQWWVRRRTANKELS